MGKPTERVNSIGRPTGAVATLQLGSQIEKPAPSKLSTLKKQGHVRNRTVPRGYESVDSVLLTEARIDYIRRTLQSLLQTLQIEVDGQPVELDGFRLKDISKWSDYGSSLSDIFWHLSSVCNYSCEFCYEKGNPENFPIQNAPRMATQSEIYTRLKHYDPIRKTGIFSVRTSINEPFMNKNAVAYLEQMREVSPTELISFVTNGSFLNESTVAALADLKPVFFNLSLYSVDDDVRKNVLWDTHGQKVRDAMHLLREHRVPYMANLVMWPSISMEDMERTIAFADQHRASLMRICLGGYTRYLKGDFDRFSTEEFWPEVVDAVERLRSRYSMPIIIEPNSFVQHSTDAILDGVIIDSPAAKTGLRRGDIILSVEGRKIMSRLHLASCLRKLCAAQTGGYRPPGVSGRTGHVHNAPDKTITMEVERDGTRFDVTLQRYDSACMASYPYADIAPFNDFLFGMVLTDTLSFSALSESHRLIAKHDAKTVLMLSSQMIRPILESMVARTSAFDGINLYVDVVENRFFGGTINVGDLLVVDDFVAAIQEFIRNEGVPDLVLVPSSPFASSPWMRDLNGIPWIDIERRTGIKVEVVECNAITF